MKLKVLSLVAALSVFTTMLVGCGTETETNTSTDKEITSVDSSTGSTENPTTQSTSKEDVTVENQVILDESDVKITVTGLEDGLFGTDLKVLIENNSTQDLTVQVREASVNGYMVEPMISSDVAAGKKVNDTITFSTSALKDCGITEIADMNFAFHIFTTADWKDYLDTDIITVKTNKAATYEYTFDDSGNVIYDVQGIKIVAKHLSTDDSIFGPGLVLYMANDTDETITVQARDTSVNGFMVDGVLSQEISPGKKALTALTFLSSTLEENNITDITDIETAFHIFDSEDWETIVDTDKIVLTF